MSEKTRVKEALNLVYHGMPVSMRPMMFSEVREWLEEMDRDAVLAKARVEDPVGVKLAEQRLDIKLSDFDPTRMAERMRIECELREEARENTNA